MANPVQPAPVAPVDTAGSVTPPPSSIQKAAVPNSPAKAGNPGSVGTAAGAPPPKTVFQAASANPSSLPQPSLPPAPSPKAAVGFTPSIPRPTYPTTLPTAPGDKPVLNAATLPPLKQPGLPPPPAKGTGPVPTGVPSVAAGGNASLPPSTPSPAAPKPAFAKSPFRFLPFVVGGLVVLMLILVLLSKIFGGNKAAKQNNVNTTPTVKTSAGQTVLTYWGLWEPNAVLSEVLSDFEKQNPSIKVEYKQETYKDYRDRLQNAIVSGQGPDLFRYHASWVPMLSSELAPVPENVMTSAEFQSAFYPVAYQQLTLGGKQLGIPLEYDGLALFYNDEALRTANIQVPQTWRDMKTAATQLTIRNGAKISRAGAALGTAGNVEHFSDILGLLILQNGGDPAAPTSQQAIDALDFYTRFATADKVWDASLPSSTTAFARGDVAMMLAPSWRVHDIKAINPNLKFSIAPVPQLTSQKVAWASYWVEGVNNQGKHQAEAWTLLKYLSSPEVLQKLYASASKQRTFGEIYPRQDLANTIASDPLVAPFLADAPFASSWYLNSYTHDNGINDQNIKYYEDAVNAIVGGQEVKNVVATVQLGVAQVLRTYGLRAPAAATTTTP